MSVHSRVLVVLNLQRGWIIIKIIIRPPETLNFREKKYDRTCRRLRKKYEYDADREL